MQVVVQSNILFMKKNYKSENVLIDVHIAIHLKKILWYRKNIDYRIDTEKRNRKIVLEQSLLFSATLQSLIKLHLDAGNRAIFFTFKIVCQEVCQEKIGHFLESPQHRPICFLPKRVVQTAARQHLGVICQEVNCWTHMRRWPPTCPSS